MKSSINITLKREQHTVPEWFREAVALAGGKNRFADPNVRVVWSQSPEALIVIDGKLRPEYEGVPCWLLQSWDAPEVYGSPEMWFRDNKDPQTGRQLFGDFPWKGRYRTLQPLILREVVNGKLVVESLPLSSFILNVMIPLIRQAADVSVEKQRAAMKELEDRKGAEQEARIADALQNAMPAFDGAAFSARTGYCTTTLQRKVYQIEQNMQSALRLYAKLGKGAFAPPAPRPEPLLM